MTLTLTPARLKGAVTPPPSKSQAHRLLLAAALAEGESVISNVARSQDMDATVNCLAELGAEFRWEGDGLSAPAALRVTGMGAGSMSPNRRMALPRLDCGESGSTLRFLIPVALAVRGGGVFTGHGRLMERPLKPYFDLFEERGIFYERKGGTLTVQGRLEPGEYRLPGNVSSQFFTGLLYALPLLEGDSLLVNTTRLESVGYVDMTCQAMEQFGVHTTWKRDISIPGGQRYRAFDASVEADWSNAAFWYAACFAGCDLEIGGLNAFSAQGDMRIAPYFMKLRGEGPVELDVSQCPDLVPPLAAMAALRGGETTAIVNAGRLRLKESDRLAAVTAVLNAMGARVEEHPDSLVIHGRDALPGGVTVDSHNDHRIAMMAAIAATRCEKPVTITGAECVAKSYPSFWEEYARLGGNIREVRA